MFIYYLLFLVTLQMIVGGEYHITFMQSIAMMYVSEILLDYFQVQLKFILHKSTEINGKCSTFVTLATISEIPRFIEHNN